jgi:hypothetical protein
MMRARLDLFNLKKAGGGLNVAQLADFVSARASLLAHL